MLVSMEQSSLMRFIVNRCSRISNRSVALSINTLLDAAMKNNNNKTVLTKSQEKKKHPHYFTFILFPAPTILTAFATQLLIEWRTKCRFSTSRAAVQIVTTTHQQLDNPPKKQRKSSINNKRQMVIATANGGVSLHWRVAVPIEPDVPRVHSTHALYRQQRPIVQPV
jgi:hypothetical protein